jgi:hypothetical protein
MSTTRIFYRFYFYHLWNIHTRFTYCMYGNVWRRIIEKHQYVQAALPSLGLIHPFWVLVLEVNQSKLPCHFSRVASQSPKDPVMRQLELSAKTQGVLLALTLPTILATLLSLGLEASGVCSPQSSVGRLQWPQHRYFPLLNVSGGTAFGTSDQLESTWGSKAAILWPVP